MELTIDTLQAEKQSLQKQLEQSKGQTQALSGALAMVEHLIAKVQAPTAVPDAPIAETPADQEKILEALVVQGTNGSSSAHDVDGVNVT